ncbi:Protein kinase domain-containing protein [Mycena indigotica]|uniref:Protein kinase domain-containing protein n=1 Tax=Mycena indigotica TaxID=2126181 RepID=A0A8H6W258_9AGAR|nr:Protein kinase domain-containing protein [Mycena indigotica]KAF7302222.1 Protein kinase domain-containing protein [Mycena indigotica]
MPPRDFNPSDIYWLEKRTFLETLGYRLRPKYQPDYVPDFATRYDDYWAAHFGYPIMDAHRVFDDKPVILKLISTRVHPHEVEIARFFSSQPIADDPRNHCVPILDVLQDPNDTDKQIIVMPRLVKFDQPEFQTVGEVIDCFRQLFEGLELMHENFVAHRDCWRYNIAQDPTLLFPKGFHPVWTDRDPSNKHPAYHLTRTECWPRYFFIDFGLSRRYDPSNGPPREPIIRGGDRSPPEHHTNLACNPFPTDIYFLGNLLKTQFLYSRRLGKRQHVLLSSLGFLKPLVDAMVQPGPALRPTIGEVIQRFDKLCSSLSEFHLGLPGRAHRFHFGLFFRQITRTLKRVPPLPASSQRHDRQIPAGSMREFFTQDRESISDGRSLLLH